MKAHPNLPAAAPDAATETTSRPVDEEPPEDEAFRQALRDAALRRIRFLMDFYQVAPRELAAVTHPAAATKASMPAPRVAAAPKYRHPVTGDTWDGMGAQPAWLREALLRQGYAVEELRVGPAEAGGG